MVFNDFVGPKRKKRRPHDLSRSGVAVLLCSPQGGGDNEHNRGVSSCVGRTPDRGCPKRRRRDSSGALRRRSTRALTEGAGPPPTSVPHPVISPSGRGCVNVSDKCASKSHFQTGSPPPPACSRATRHPTVVRGRGPGRGPGCQPTRLSTPSSAALGWGCGSATASSRAAWTAGSRGLPAATLAECIRRS